MVTRRQIYEHYLKSAEAALKERVKSLADKKQLSEKQAKRDATCRKYEAVMRKFKRRIKALDSVDQVNADLVTRRAEKAARPKEEKPKKKAAEAAPKAKAPKASKKAPEGG